METKQVIYEHNRLAIDLLPEEHVLNVQRQHPIALGMLFVIHAFLISLIFAILLLFFFLRLPSLSPQAFIFSALLCLSILATIGIYTCMEWYFTFYIITNKRLIIWQYFRITGKYYQEVLLKSGSQLETKRVTPNIFYDFFEIEDIDVTVHMQDTPASIVFKTPSRSHEIEMAIAEIETRLTNI